MKQECGTLYTVATPIGNLADLSSRAEQVLRNVDMVACEHTHKTARLLQGLNIRKVLKSYHEHNEKKQSDLLCQKLQKGHSIALLCDAGTPCLSDPGFRLVSACRAQNIPVCPIPGPSVVTTFLSACGLPTHAFLFLGFPPLKKGKRMTYLNEQTNSPYTLILLESTHRIERLLEEIALVFGPNRCLSLGRELTKLHETWHVGTCEQVQEKLKNTCQKGEFILGIATGTFQLPQKIPLTDKSNRQRNLPTHKLPT